MVVCVSRGELQTNGFMRGHRSRRRLSVLLFLLIVTPAILSPLHPIAVYGYLFKTYFPSATETAYASSSVALATFLLSSEQVSRYQDDLRADMLDKTTGKMFAIVQRVDGSYRQEPIRTWNGFLPASSPRWLTRWMDRKELPFLSDEVTLWLRGDRIIAMGHYHAFGGVPSPGDRAAQWFSELPEIVVVNSLVPLVYVDGSVLYYGDIPAISREVHRMIRAVEPSLLIPTSQFRPLTTELTPETNALLGYLENARNADISSREEVVDAIEQLWMELTEHLTDVFDRGRLSEYYTDDIDREVYAGHLETIGGWVKRMRVVIKRDSL